MKRAGPIGLIPDRGAGQLRPLPGGGGALGEAVRPHHRFTQVRKNGAIFFFKG